MPEPQISTKGSLSYTWHKDSTGYIVCQSFGHIRARQMPFLFEQAELLAKEL